MANRFEECMLCEALFETVEEKASHYLMHQITCPICFVVCASNVILIEHVMIYHPKCDECETLFFTQERKFDHDLIYHQFDF